MTFINTSYFFEVDTAGQEKRFRLFAIERDDNEIDEPVDPEETFEGVKIEEIPGGDKVEILTLGGLRDMPEYRTRAMRHTYDQHGVRITIRSPTPQRRLCHRTLKAAYSISSSNDESVREVIRRCMREVLHGSILVSAIEHPGHALAGYHDLVQKALQDRGVLLQGPLRLGLYTEKELKPWRNLATKKDTAKATIIQHKDPVKDGESWGT